MNDYHILYRYVNCQNISNIGYNGEKTKEKILFGSKFFEFRKELWIETSAMAWAIIHCHLPLVAIHKSAHHWIFR